MKRTLLIAVLAVAFISCDDIFEKDITKTRVVTIAPSDGVIVEPGEITFLWNEVKGAASYHFRIIEKRGIAIADVILYNDSTSVKRSYKCQLDDGEYLWSIKAKNSAYETDETTATLIVESPEPADIPEEEIQVVEPANI